MTWAGVCYTRNTQDHKPGAKPSNYLFYRLKQGMKTCYEWRQALLTAATHCQFNQQHISDAVDRTDSG